MKHRYQNPSANLLAFTLGFGKSIDKDTINTSHQLSARSDKGSILSIGTSVNKTIDLGEFNNRRQNMNKKQYEIRPIKQTIKNKFRTFSDWSALTEYKQFRKRIKSTKKSENKQKQQQQNQTTPDFLKALFVFTQQLEKKKKREETLQKKRKLRSKNQPNLHLNQQINSQKRQRLKKMKNPLGIVHHYQHHSGYLPSSTQKILIDKLIELKASLQGIYKDGFMPKKQQNASKNLIQILDKIFQLMNLAVDFNEMRLLIILILLAADTSFYSLDYNRAFYFYRQAAIASEFSQLLTHKIEAFMGMAAITFQKQEVQYTILFLKKALSYAWFIEDVDIQMMIYEHLGKTYFLNGEVEKAKYFHRRCSQNKAQCNSSASKIICLQIVNGYRKQKKYYLYDNNINLLFIQTLSLPIKNFVKYPQHSSAGSFENYINGDSPRKYRQDNNRFLFDQDFPKLQDQIKHYISKDQQFQKDMPDPAVEEEHKRRKVIRKHRQIQFQRSVQYHLIASDKCEANSKIRSKGLTLAADMPDLRIKMPLDQRVDKVLKEKPDQNLFEKMLHRIKMDKLHKVGDLKQRICKSHLKIRERKRALSTQPQKIKFSLNKALIDWIDPIK